MQGDQNDARPTAGHEHRVQTRGHLRWSHSGSKWGKSWNTINGSHFFTTITEIILVVFGFYFGCVPCVMCTMTAAALCLQLLPTARFLLDFRSISSANLGMKLTKNEMKWWCDWAFECSFKFHWWNNRKTKYLTSASDSTWSRWYWVKWTPRFAIQRYRLLLLAVSKTLGCHFPY